ncbi:hypothetical protein HPB50_007286 [Hyalomma asiaticum]|uniref:Uncharacterized protein n=1 Tax=Hyalomma asiaticum TaxID=266040 RepID=A0ACB7S1W6_HYAAI|nr:hypothetical protein HPB50_007286 [Hyalomma asiaticum]
MRYPPLPLLLNKSRFGSLEPQAASSKSSRRRRARWSCRKSTRLESEACDSMAAIRDFFKKRKAEVKFKQAGPGRRLNADNTPLAHSPPRLQQTQQRGAPSEGAQRAAAAALARLEQQQAKTHPNWSVAAIKSQAKKELEQQLAAEEVASKRNSTPTVLESGPQAGDNAVVFGHPLLGPELRLPYEELRSRIRQFLYEQMSEEPGLTSCLLIHTCNSPQAKVDTGVETLCKYLNNIADHPSEEKYRRIRLNNRIFQERVLPLEGALEFLQACCEVVMRRLSESWRCPRWLCLCKIPLKLCDQRAILRMDSASVDALIKRTAKLTQVSERTLYRWKTEMEDAGEVLPPKKRSCGKGLVHGFFEKGKVPTIAKVVQRFKKDETLPTVSMATIQRMLKKLGFRYKKRSRNALLIEATHIVQSRRRYLRQIAELRRQVPTATEKADSSICR